MKLLFAIFVLVLLFGPLRPWVGRHWAFLLSIIAGGAFGFFLGLLAVGPSCPFLPFLWGLVGAIAAARTGPSILRKLQKDGRDEHSSRRH
jgi:hypothetical protein